MAHWRNHKTLLLVGEGIHDEAFLTHVKRHKAPRGCGLIVTIRNANGKGALHVVDYTIRQKQNAQFDQVAAMVDTDTDYSDRVLALAKRHRITLISAAPCFEALLLRTIDQKLGETKQLKKQLSPFVNDKPGEASSYEKHFGLPALENACEKEEALRILLDLFSR
ncbi:hypothetical protein FHW67_003125 [Herbaspirillum sp. Sphag1AN]|uniref:RloB domain-containing protein n=1 Tax=unclassified Herbaspirillum TaxID=2624150 RepID=UPI001607475C|nr:MULTISPECIES: RloB domain-containing protein [unclassified Herbaspirillum]MBB3213824.1 hypothetical protein [Herbaspirillum sp. Sphag1AN]MBB3247021.1 hypothetical protein [Herbaspirillum sp. Sphag64]